MSTPGSQVEPLARVIPVSGPAPYVSPDIRRRQCADAPSDESHLRPWQRRRAGETESERIGRCYHCCYRCGHHEDDLAVLDVHEATCRRGVEGEHVD